MFVDDNLDKKQEEAVYTRYDNVEVCAPPGSGKTTVIINRVCNLIENRGVNPDNIVVITFTKSAAVNMKNRYEAISIIKNRIPFFGTFHSLFYRILLKYRQDIAIIEEDCAFKIVKNVLKMYLDHVPGQKTREVLNDISIMKNKNYTIKDFKSKTDKSVFEQCFKTYEDYKNKNNLFDFDDIQLQARELFLNNEDILNGYRSIFRYVLVDEFQDCDSLQLELLQLICRGNSIFAVGDEDQCIYGFRGSNPKAMVNFNKYFDKGEKLFLNINYRSVKNIVELSKQLISNNKNRNLKTINSNKEHEGKIEFFTFKEEWDEAECISNKIKEIIKCEKYKRQDIAIVYRTNVESRSIIDAFLKNNIKFKFLDRKYNFFEHFICSDIISYLKTAVRDYDVDSFTAMINRPYRYISRVNIEKVKMYPVRENCFDILKSIRGLSVSQIKNISRLKRNISRLCTIPLIKAIDCVIYKLGYMDYLEQLCRKSNIDISQFEIILEEFKQSVKNYNDIESFLRYIEEFSNSIEHGTPDDDSVILSSIHGVKGMEFKNVFIVNCNDGIIPHVNSIPNSLEEERRLFYVGMTRAIDNLYIYSVKNIFGGPVKISRFVDEIL